jgi:hypothetical protein
MGLLRKAAVTAGLGESGSRKQAAAPYESDRPKGPGLLGRSIKALRPGTLPEAPSTAPLAIELAEKNAETDLQPIQFQVRSPGVEALPPVAPPPPPPSGRRFEDLLEETLSAIASLRGGVELPSRLFTVLTSLLGVRKGALLLYDPVRLVYAPWAVRGYDQTTTHRMRIPLGANEAWNALGNGRPIFLAGAPALAPFQRYFSSREFSSVTRLVLVPFISENKLIAVFELTEIDSPFSSDDELSACLAQAAEAGAPRIYQARAAQIAASGSGGGRPQPVTVRDEPAQFVSSLGSSRTTVLLLALSLEDYATSVLQAHEHLDPFRLHEDLLYFLGSFLVDVGKLFPVRQGRFVIALPDFDPAGLDLLTHQLSMFLQGLFGGTETRADRVLPRIVKSSSWPADGADLRSLVESLST